MNDNMDQEPNILNELKAISKPQIVLRAPGLDTIPLGSILASASPAEVKLAEKTLEEVKVPRKGKGRPKKRATIFMTSICTDYMVFFLN